MLCFTYSLWVEMAVPYFRGPVTFVKDFGDPPLLVELRNSLTKTGR